MRGRASKVLVALAICLLFVGAAVTLSGSGEEPRSSSTGDFSEAQSSEVRDAVGDILERVFTYRHDESRVTEAAAKRYLRGEADARYRELLAPILAVAQKQRLELSAEVVAAGVKRMEHDRATLLVFLDQSSVRHDTGGTATAAAQLRISALREGAGWRVTGLEVL